MKKVIALDISTTCTGYAIFKGSKLVDFGQIKYKILKEHADLPLLTRQIIKASWMASEISDIIYKPNPDIIIIEQMIVNTRAGILPTKMLAGCHFLTLTRVFDQLDKVIMVTPGKWRNTIKKQLTDTTNSITIKMPIKKLCHKYVEDKYKIKIGTKYDISDAIAIGDSFLIGGNSW